MNMFEHVLKIQTEGIDRLFQKQLNVIKYTFRFFDNVERNKNEIKLERRTSRQVARIRKNDGSSEDNKKGLPPKQRN